MSAAYEAAMRRLTGQEQDAVPEPQLVRKAKRRRHGGAGGKGNKRHAPPLPPPAPAASTAASAQPLRRPGSLADCGLALGPALVRDVAGACQGWSGGAAAAHCAACGAGPGAHALLDTRRHDGRGAPAARRAYLALREARALGYCPGAAAGDRPLEARLATHTARLSRLLRALAATGGGGVASLAEQAAALLPAAGAGGRAALRLVALLDAAYAELFIADCLAPPSSAGGLPPPHVHLATLLPALPAGGGACSECAPPSAAPAHAPAALLCAACARRNPQLAYIRLRDAEAAGPLDLRRLSAACLAAEGPTAGPAGGTMRGCDPVGCDTLRLWQAAVRDRMAAWAAFACPDAAAARAVAEFAAAGAGGALLEVGAGTGYWAGYLARACPSLRVSAHDVRPTDAAACGGGGGRGRLNEYHCSLPPWFAVQPGDAAAVAAVAAAAAAAAGRPPPALLICYPPPCMSASGSGDMALSAVAAFSAAGGRQLALVGEWRGDTGSAALERKLAECWALDAAPLALPGYANTCATLTLWRHRGSDAAARGGGGSALRWPLECVACGATPPLPDGGGKARPFLRDRLTRAVVACSQACARAPATLAALEAELLARHLPPLRRRKALAAERGDAADVAFAWEDSDAALGKLVWRSAALL
jgi:hypothetical protein